MTLQLGEGSRLLPLPVAQDLLCVLALIVGRFGPMVLLIVAWIVFALIFLVFVFSDDELKAAVRWIDRDPFGLRLSKTRPIGAPRFSTVGF